MKNKLMIPTALTTGFVGYNANPEKTPWNFAKAWSAFWCIKSLPGEVGKSVEKSNTIKETRSQQLMWNRWAKGLLKVMIDENLKEKNKEFNDCLISSTSNKGVEDCVNTILLNNYLNQETFAKIEAQRKRDYKKLIKPLGNIFNVF
jgi:hypothetical protein